MDLLLTSTRCHVSRVCHVSRMCVVLAFENHMITTFASPIRSRGHGDTHGCSSSVNGPSRLMWWISMRMSPVAGLSGAWFSQLGVASGEWSHDG